MRIKFEKTMKIASELLSYCHRMGASEFHLDITEGNHAVSLVIRAKPEHITIEAMERLRIALEAPRQREIEQDYWELMGEVEGSSEMTLLGMLCDETSVVYEGDELTITLVRYD
ncbi:MAG: hypothetical protein FWC66_08845 [Oscillospiraceae bacterium]|nr:hypothetical protein [Oscillospiraceae bacterium]